MDNGSFEEIGPQKGYLHSRLKHIIVEGALPSRRGKAYGFRGKYYELSKSHGRAFIGPTEISAVY